MRSISLLLPLTMLLGVPSCADPVDDVIVDQMQASHLPGAAVAIVDNGRVTKLAGYGDANLEWPAKVDPDTRFQIASATKMFTGILLMRQVERGHLSLDDPLSKYFADAPASWSNITVRQLANHTSGLSENLGEPRPKTVTEAVVAAMHQDLAYEPGSEARYGFTDFTILRAIIEQVSGKTLPALLENDLTSPLGLKSTGFALAEDDGGVRTGELINRRATVYAWLGDRYRTSEFFFEPLGYGAGGIYTSARDLASLFVAMDQGKVLTPESQRILATTASLPNGRRSEFGIGVTVRQYRGEEIIGHSGGPALSDIIRIPAQGRTIIVLTNQQLFFPMLAERIADLTIAEPIIGAISDDRPMIAANLKGMFNSLASGADERPFVSAGGDPAAPLRSGFGKAMIDAIGRAENATLLGIEQDGSRVYHLECQRKHWDWWVKFDENDLIVDLHPA